HPRFSRDWSSDVCSPDLTPLYAGRLVEAVSGGGSSALDAAIEAFVVLVGLGLGAVIARQTAFMTTIPFSLKIMSDTAQNAFHREIGRASCREIVFSPGVR